MEVLSKTSSVVFPDGAALWGGVFTFEFLVWVTISIAAQKAELFKSKKRTFSVGFENENGLSQILRLAYEKARAGI